MILNSWTEKKYLYSSFGKFPGQSSVILFRAIADRFIVHIHELYDSFIIIHRVYRYLEPKVGESCVLVN